MKGAYQFISSGTSKRTIFSPIIESFRGSECYRFIVGACVESVLCHMHGGCPLFRVPLTSDSTSILCNVLTILFLFIYRMENPWSSPLSELSKWRQRHCLLLAVVEQLKVKETRTVFTVLVAAKSRMLRKWKSTDTQ